MVYFLAVPGIAILVLAVFIIRRHPVIAIVLLILGAKMAQFGGAYAAIFAAKGM